MHFSKRFVRLVSLCLIAAVALGVGITVIAQDELPGAGEGGAVIRGNQRGSANIGPLIDIRCSGVDCSDVNAVLWPDLIGLDPATLQYAPSPDVSNVLATGWEISEDGLTVTVNLRDDMTWNDGTPITANDVYFTWLAMQQGQNVGLSGSFQEAASVLTGAEVVDDYTIRFSVEVPNCEVMRQVALVPPLPSAAYGFTDAASFDWGSMIDHPFDDAPTVTSGPFNFERVEPGTAIYLSANPGFVAPDAHVGYTVPSAWVYVDTPDETVGIERFLAFQPGDINYVFEPSGGFDQIINSEAQSFHASGRTWHYVALNLADPTNPQNGLDEEGNPIDQGHHPIFGDVKVRQALQHAINIDEIIDGPLQGYGTAMNSGVIPTAYTLDPDLQRRPYDLDAARALLDEAGWVSTGDPLVDGGDGLRTCQGCQFAEEGTELAFEMMNVGDIRNDVSVILQDQFADIGVQVDVVVLDFNTMYDNNMGAQTYDTAVAGWRGALPFDPDQRSFFGAENDIFGEGYGFNFPSYYNAEFEELSEQISTLPGCDTNERIELARQTERILWEDQPYLWLYARNNLYAAAPNVGNFDPLPDQGGWNIDAWNVVE
jgi:peptide/nickel transport system substrate-binding protein